MGEFRRHRAWIAWVAIIAVLSNVVGAFAFSNFAQPGASDYPVDLLGPLVICTGHGLQAAPSDDGKAPEAPGKHCPMCLTPSVFALIIALVAAALLAPLSVERRFAPHLCATFADGLRRSGLGSRAPPLPA
jgi:hypothetical protein